jgi:hypothetical protein
MLYRLITNHRLFELGLMRFVILFVPLLSLLFLGALALTRYIALGAFILDAENLVGAICFGLIMTALGWYRVRISNLKDPH